MYRAPPVVSPILDIAEKSRAYERHTYALIHNVHQPISTPPDIAPSIAVYRRRRDAEREKTIQQDRKHAKTIDLIFKRQHNIPIPDDFTALRRSRSTTRSRNHASTSRASQKSWSSVLQEKEKNFPTKDEIKFSNSRSINRVDFRSDSQQSTFREPESGMRVNYNSKSRPRTGKSNRTLNSKEYIRNKVTERYRDDDYSNNTRNKENNDNRNYQNSKRNESSSYQNDDSITFNMDQPSDI